MWAIYYTDGARLHFLAKIEAASRDHAMAIACESIPVEHHKQLAVMLWHGPVARSTIS
jgi:hypothetical protein